VDVLSELFDRLVRAETAFIASVTAADRYVADGKIIRLQLEPLRQAVAKREDLRGYYKSKRVWVPRSVCVPLDTLLSFGWSLSKPDPVNDQPDAVIHMTEAGWREFLTQSMRLRSEIESEVRRTLEVLEPPDTSPTSEESRN
jgi:hypothetical protein